MLNHGEVIILVRCGVLTAKGRGGGGRVSGLGCKAKFERERDWKEVGGLRSCSY